MPFGSLWLPVVVSTVAVSALVAKLLSRGESDAA